MIRRNLAFREDIPADALRQRRDMYVLAIGLLIFNLARGSVVAQSTSGILAVKLEHPHIVLWAAWIGFFYFWWRFWLVSKVRPFADFLKAAEWQLGNLPAVRRIAAPFVEPGTGWNKHDSTAELLAPTGPVPKATLSNNKISLNSLRATVGDSVARTYGPNNIEIPTRAKWIYRRAKIVAVYRAITCERVFTDYTLPHLFALLTVIVGLFRLTCDLLSAST